MTDLKASCNVISEAIKRIQLIAIDFCDLELKMNYMFETVTDIDFESSTDSIFELWRLLLKQAIFSSK